MNLSDQSRIWIYLSSRYLTDAEVEEINLLLQQFCIQWTAHGANLRAFGEVRHHRFIVLMVDETAAGASGCSIDKSVHFIQQIENQFDVRLFNRMLVAWKEGEEIHVSNLDGLQKLFDDGVISEHTVVFDTTVMTKKDLDTGFEISLGQSWMMKRIRTPKPVT
jgi:hypothetical protein